MRDIIFTLFVFGTLPFIFKRPQIGIMMWVWISVMNPHRLTWGFAHDFPYAAIVAATTLAALLLTTQDKELPKSPIIWALMAFSAWMVVTTAFSLFPDPSFEFLGRVLKTMLMTVVAVMLIKKKEDLYMLVWVLVGSLAYYGVKGGLFTIASGGSYIVWGPEDSYIEGNNELALALVTIIPMMYFLVLASNNKWVKMGMLAALLLCALAALGSYSRGALVAIAAMVCFLWWKSPRKILMATVMVIVIPALVAFMPAKWSDRMDTINTYQEDSSAMGRINAWQMATNLALDRPLVGGGYAIWTGPVFQLYAPNPADHHAAHSIYFQALGEHGFIGLGLYLLMAFLTLRRCAWINRMCAQRDDLKWAASLATMVQVSLLGFAVGGAFLSLLYYDTPYYLMAIVVSTGHLVEKTLKGEAAAQRAQQGARKLLPRVAAAAKLPHA